MINKKIKTYILNYNPAKFHAFSTMCTIVTKICLTKIVTIESYCDSYCVLSHYQVNICSTSQYMKFSTEDFLHWMWPNLQFPADLVAFTDEILNGKLRFMCSGKKNVKMTNLNFHSFIYSQKTSLVLSGWAISFLWKIKITKMFTDKILYIKTELQMIRITVHFSQMGVSYTNRKFNF